MNTRGKLLTEQQIRQTRGHYSINKGIRWDLKEVGQRVTRGGEAIAKDPRITKELKDGLVNLIGTCPALNVAVDLDILVRAVAPTSGLPPA